MKKNDFSKVYSFSKLEKFEKCPQDYYFYYLDPQWKGYQRPRDYKTKGQAVHDAITLFYHLPPEKQNFESLKECLFEGWYLESDHQKGPPLGRAGGFDSLDHERETYRHALKLLKNFWEMADSEPDLFYLPQKDIKRSFKDYEDLIQPIDSRFFISGKFDRIDRLKDGGLAVIDFKTGKENQDKFQLDFYKLLAELNFGLPVRKASFYYLASKKVLDFPVADVSTAEIKNGILEKLFKIESTSEFSPRPSRLCHYCDFKPICPVFRQN